jgi:hypothetical protein
VLSGVADVIEGSPGRPTSPLRWTTYQGHIKDIDAVPIEHAINHSKALPAKTFFR